MRSWRWFPVVTDRHCSVKTGISSRASSGAWTALATPSRGSSSAHLGPPFKASKAGRVGTSAGSRWRASKSPLRLFCHRDLSHRPGMWPLTCGASMPNPLHFWTAVSTVPARGVGESCPPSFRRRRQHWAAGKLGVALHKAQEMQSELAWGTLWMRTPGCTPWPAPSPRWACAAWTSPPLPATASSSWRSRAASRHPGLPSSS
mmetsp:Transcript_102305/g.259839  ORF Transcript_102305/g.259839 Transcript_102305/m.259839 type:complete len:203 (+) Transcript_102305:1127-1735(+)